MSETESNLPGLSTKLAAMTRTTGAAQVQAHVVVLMVAFSLMSYFDRTIMSIAAPGIMKEFSLSETEMGWVFTAFLMSYAAMNLPGIVSWKCTCLCGDPLCHGDLHWTSLPLVCQNLCQLDSSLRACPCPGLHCRRSRAGWSHLATVILLDDQSLRMAHVV